MTDEEEAPRPTERRSRFTSLFTPSAEAELSDPQLRERMRTLDTTERKVGFGDAGVVIFAALLIIPYLLKNTKQTTATTLPHSSCVGADLKWNGKICVQTVVYHPSHFALPFILLLCIGVVLLFAVWRSMRALTIFMSLFAAIAGFRYSPIIFLCGMGVAIWLLVRSWRLQRFGAKDSKTVRKVATERAAERKVARRAAKDSSTAPSVTGKPAPTPSKRYTAPKAKPRRK